MKKKNNLEKQAIKVLKKTSLFQFCVICDKCLSIEERANLQNYFSKFFTYVKEH